MMNRLVQAGDIESKIRLTKLKSNWKNTSILLRYVCLSFACHHTVAK